MANRGVTRRPGPVPAAPWIKVCGVRRLREVEACARAGATHVGLNAWPRSPRYVPPRDLGLLAEAAAAQGLVPVVVHVPGSPLDPGLFARVPGLLLQSPAPPPRALRRRMEEGGGAWVEARPARPELLPALPRGAVLLVDAPVAGMHGGTGRRIDPALLRVVPRPFVLAGGLNPDNVAEAVRLASPAGVDAASGLESSLGVKDEGKIRAYCQAAREAFERVRSEK